MNIVDDEEGKVYNTLTLLNDYYSAVQCVGLSRHAPSRRADLTLTIRSTLATTSSPKTLFPIYGIVLVVVIPSFCALFLIVSIVLVKMCKKNTRPAQIMR